MYTICYNIVPELFNHDTLQWLLTLCLLNSFQPDHYYSLSYCLCCCFSSCFHCLHILSSSHCVISFLWCVSILKPPHLITALPCPEFDFSTGLLDDSIISCKYVENSPDKVKTALRILQLNIRGILSKQQELRDLLITNSIDIALICETWLASNNENRLSIAGYNSLVKVRTGRKGGGVCILIKDHLLYRPIKCLKDLDIELEYCAAKIKTDSAPLVVCSAYRPPNSNARQFLSHYINLTTTINKFKSKGLIIGLDHNLDLLKHSSHSITQEFLDTNFDIRLLPSITKLTRITNSTATLTDNIFIDCSLKLCKSLIIYDDISDHLPCMVECEDLMNSPLEENMAWKKYFDKKV